MTVEIADGSRQVQEIRMVEPVQIHSYLLNKLLLFIPKSRQVNLCDKFDLWNLYLKAIAIRRILFHNHSDFLRRIPSQAYHAVLRLPIQSVQACRKGVKEVVGWINSINTLQHGTRCGSPWLHLLLVHALTIWSLLPHLWVAVPLHVQVGSGQTITLL